MTTAIAMLICASVAAPGTVTFDCTRLDGDPIAPDVVRAAYYAFAGHDVRNFSGRLKHYQDYFDYVFLDSENPELCSSKDPIIRWCNLVWETHNKRKSYEDACKELLAIDNTYEYLMLGEHLSSPDQIHTDKWAEKYHARYFFELFVYGLCAEITAKCNASVKMLGVLSEGVDGGYGEELAGELYELVDEKPDLVLAHAKEFYEMRYDIRLAMSWYPEKREAVLNKYRALGRNANTELILKILSGEERPEK